jgi:hypothetical protein
MHARRFGSSKKLDNLFGIVCYNIVRKSITVYDRVCFNTQNLTDQEENGLHEKRNSDRIIGVFYRVW